jgi:hypothetical protein
MPYLHNILINQYYKIKDLIKNNPTPTHTPLNSTKQGKTVTLTMTRDVKLSSRRFLEPIKGISFNIPRRAGSLWQLLTAARAAFLE